jgi:hypothetical protein
MECVGLPSFAASLVFMICMYTFFQTIHALQNHSTGTRLLKVGVPARTDYEEFISVEKNGPNITVGGFSVKVFEASIKTLNYSVHYIPIDAHTAFSYDSIIDQIVLKVEVLSVIGSLDCFVLLIGNSSSSKHHSNILISFMLYLLFLAVQNLDAAVGDLTITSKRSQEVLFTQPFFDSGLVAVVPLKDQVTISFGWAFTKPFTGEMWLLLAGFFISGGMVVYILERSNNRRFRGQPSKQFGSVLW